MPRYQVPLAQASVATAFKSAGVLFVTSATRARRFNVYEYNLGQYGSLSSTDSQVYYDVSRTTATSLLAGTAVAANLNDTADDLSLALFSNNITTEIVAGNFAGAGLGLNLVQEAQNQRGSYRWRALETYDLLTVPATSLNGLAFRVQSIASGYTASIVGQVLYLE
jgi:hypothetical protein